MRENVKLIQETPEVLMEMNQSELMKAAFKNISDCAKLSNMSPIIVGTSDSVFPDNS